MPLKKIVVLASGGGTNFQTLIDKIHNKYAEISTLIADNPSAGALNRARNAGIEGEVIDYKALGAEAFFKELYRFLDERDPDLIVLAGFMKILPASFYARFKNKIINIHPALIPSFCGKGYYGIRVHEAVVDYGAKVSGATVHFADGEADTGPIIMQKALYVGDDDTAEILQARVLEIEHEILPLCVGLFCEDKITVNGRKVKIKKDE